MNVTTVPILQDLQGPWAAFAMELVGPDVPAGAEPKPIADVFPFTSVTDLKRLLWIQRGGDPRWSPERVFLGVRSAGGIRPIEFHWTTNTNSVDLPDPMEPANQIPSDLLVDPAGNRKPVTPTMIGSLVLEDALSPEMTQTGGAIPVVTAISLAAIAADATPERLTAALFGGFYQRYFPWLTAPAQVLDAGSTAQTPAIREALAAAVPYTEDRTGRISVVQRALRARVGGATAAMTTMVRLRWAMPIPAAKPESLERLFYGLHASATLPFLRYFPQGGKSAPLLKLGLNPDGSPIIDDPRVLTQYINQPAPVMKSAVIMARVPMTSPHVERGSAFTLHLFEDGTSDITLEVPQRGATYIAAVAEDATRRLREVIGALGYPAGTEPVLRDLHATFKWTHPDPRRAAPLSAAKLAERVAALTPFLDNVPRRPDDTALAVFHWRAVSNYESETSQFAYITQMVLRGGDEEGAAAHARYIAELSERFGLTAAAAEELMARWVERRGEAVAPAAGAGAAAFAVPRHSTGASVAVSGTHPEYAMEIQGVESYTELQRLVSVVAVLLGAPAADLRIAPPAPAVVAAAAAVEVADAVVEEAVVAEGGDAEPVEIDPAFMAMMAGLGFGGDDAPPDDAPADMNAIAAEAQAQAQLVVEEVAEAAAAAAPPDLEGAVVAVEEECRGTPWRADEPPLKIPADYYMAKLKDRDRIMFGFSATATGRVKGYSKSCQRRDDRQPNILTRQEYIRIRNCYRERVKFVTLPPNKAADLPQDPTYNPRKKYDDTYFLTDPATKQPMWTVYGYESKTRPGEFLYLMCSELWCERDNLPLIRAEFEAAGGRCPFCGGAAFTDILKPRTGESVIVRAPKEATGKLHQFIGFITRKGTRHPDGTPLPCCDSTPRLLKKYMDAAAAGRLVFGKDLAAEEDEAAEEAAAAGEEVAEPAPELELDAAAAAEGATTDYRKLLGSMQAQYVLGGDKALEAGKLGELTPALDAFFGQVSGRAIEKRGIRSTFTEDARIFVRVGVDTRLRSPGLNLFAGLAPLLGRSSAEEMLREILGRRMVRAFESANYGTLMMEFAAKGTVTEDELTKSLPEFAGEFGYRLDTNRPHVIRLYKAWTAFLRYLADPRQPKRIRHLEHLLAQPGVITPRGLLLVVLEQQGDRVQIVCPSFGIPPAPVFGDVPIAFLWHDRRDETWEPLVLYNGTPTAVTTFGERAVDLASVPADLRQSLLRWLRDWRSSSYGCGRPTPPPHVWTPDRDTRPLPRLSFLRRRAPTALVRDRSNRLVGVLLPSAGQTFFVPCLDDGALTDGIPRVFEAESIPPVPLEPYLRFYQELATEFAGLAPTKILARMTDATVVVGFQTAVGSMVPVAPGPLPASALPIQQMDAFPWERDALILRDPAAPPTVAAVREESTASVEEQLAEAYQYLRLAFSRWLTRDARGPVVRTEMGRLLVSALPLYESRKRMDILLEPLIREWISPERTDQRRALSLLREDCLSLGAEAECGAVDACRWSGGRCLIHAPHREAATDPVRIFTARLSDEILRYAGQRREVLDGRVPTIRVPRGVVRVGDEMYLAVRPKEGAPSVLDRLGFTGQVAMAFPEELLRFEGAEEEPVAATATAMTAITEAPVALPELPEAWREKGLELPQPAADLEDARRIVFAAATGISLEKWEEVLKSRRAKLGLPGDVNRPFQWSAQDLYVIASVALANAIFLRQLPSGQLKVDRWIAPASGGAKTPNPAFMIFWGPRQLLLTRGKVWRFQAKDLPSEFLTALDGVSPMPEADARGDSGEILEAGAAVTETPAVQLPPPAAAANAETGEGQLPPPANAPAITGTAAASAM